jgi:hypothetical protein
MKPLAIVTLCTTLALAASPTWAQNQGGMAGMNMPGMAGMGDMMGMHMMAATVTAIDAKTGLVDVTAGSMALKLHFPPASLASLKAGDKITLHLGFSKP